MSTKQYYNNTKPGETSIESRSGAKIVMDTNGGTTITSNIQEQFINQLRDDNFKGNIAPNPDQNNSFVYIGKGNVEINDQGNTNQDSTGLTASTDENIVQPVPVESPTESLPSVEPTPTPSVTPPVTEPVVEEGFIFEEELPETEFNSQQQFYVNTGVPEDGSGLEKPLIVRQEQQLLYEISGKKFTVKGKANVYVVDKTGKLTAESQLLLDSCKADNAVNSAIKMNPTNYKTIVNDKLPQFVYNGVTHNIILAVMKCPANLFCASGISVAFIAANGSNKAGGFPKSASSQVARDIPGAVIMNRNVDYDKNGLTQSGINKFNSTLNFTGAVFCITKKDGTGHIGMVLGAELIGKVGWLYTLEYNTSAPGGDQRQGGQLALRKRQIGASWSKKDPESDVAFTIAPTSQYGGGKWAPNGLSGNNSYLSIGSWITNKAYFK